MKVGRNLAAIALALFVAGCMGRTAYVGPLLPILPHPERPRLEAVAPADLAGVSPEIRARLVQRDVALKQHAEQYRAIVNEYNAWATRQNQQSGYERRDE
jgi:hypothetical protein